MPTPLAIGLAPTTTPTKRTDPPAMPMLTDLAHAARKSDLRVVEIDGWKSRGHGPMREACSIAIHHTATSNRAVGNYPTLGIVRDGRPGLSGPLSQLGLGRDGTVYVIAAGKSSHAGRTRALRQGNSCSIGIEAEHPGTGGWSAVQYKAYVRLAAALAQHYGIPIDHIEGHKEIAAPPGRKSDPNFSMDEFRRDVAQVIASGFTDRRPEAPSPASGGKYLTITGELNKGTVKVLQRWLGVEADGILGPRTISALQVTLAKAGHLHGRADGIFGPKSARAAEAYFKIGPTGVPGFYPGLIRAIQRFLNAKIKAGEL